MAKVKSNEISMKPRWYFMLGSTLLMGGFISFSIGAAFLTNITLFLLRQHGPMGQWRLQLMLDSFPLWVPLFAVTGILLGILMLKKYDFSYKKNFRLIIAGFIISVIIAGFALNYLELNKTWFRQGPMKRFYQQIEGQHNTTPADRRRGRLYQK